MESVLAVKKCWAESDQVSSNITTTSETGVMEVDSTASSSLQRNSWMEIPTLSAIMGQATSQADIRKEKEQKTKEKRPKKLNRSWENMCVS